MKNLYFFLQKTPAKAQLTWVFAILFSLNASQSWGQLNIPSVGTFVTTSWNAWNGTNPTGFTRSGSTTYRGTTASTTGGCYAIANSGLGWQASGSATSLSVVGTFRNTTGSTQTSVTIEYDAFRIVTRASRLPGWSVTSSLGAVASGLNWTYNSSATNSSPDLKTITLTGLSIPNNGSFTVTWASDRGSGSGSSPLIGLRNVKVRFNAALTPTLNPVTLGASLSTDFGTASSAVSFTANGTNLAANITATAQSGYQVSTNSSTGFGSSVSVPTGTTVWVRFAPSLAIGTYNNATAVVLSSTGASNVNVTTSSSCNSVNSVLALSVLGTIFSQNFDAMGSGFLLPSGWKIQESSASASWACGVHAVTQQANSGSPTTGATYNWGSGTNRAVGAMSSGSFASPSQIIVKTKNTSGSTINNFSVSYKGKRFRINSASASIQCFYSTNGTTWTAVAAGDIAASNFPTGTSSYTFASPTTVDRDFIITGQSIPNGGDFYIRWQISTSGANSQGVGIDDVTIKPCQTIAAPTASTPQSFCATAGATIANLVATGSGIQWYAAASGGAPLASSQVLTATTYYASQTVSGCESLTRTAVEVSLATPPNAGTLSGTQDICIGGSTTFSVSGNSATGSWSSGDAAVATINASTGVISSVAAGTASMTYTVTGTGGCSNADANRTVTVNQPATTISSIVISTGAYLWNGVTDNNWTTTSNWFERTGSGFAVASSAPSSSTNVYIFPSSATACIGSNTHQINANPLAVNDIFIASGSNLTFPSNQTLEVSGDFTNNGSLSIGTGTIIFNGMGNQNMTTSGSVLFNATINKPIATSVIMGDDLEVTGTLHFEGGVIETGSNTLFISNNASAAITGAVSSGSDKYVNGRLMRSTSNDDYLFPIGNTTYRVQSFNINVSGAGNVLGFLENNNTTPVMDRAYCDIETTTSSESEIGQGISGPDGFLDRMIFDLSSPLQWNVTNPGSGITSYDITVSANGANDFDPVIAADATEIRFLLKNGEPGNTGVQTGNVPNEFDENGFLACPNGYTLLSMMSFSTFTLVGSTGANTQLPIELLFFNARPTHGLAELTWATASELNNESFTVERSIDGMTWEMVLQTPGTGTTTQQTNYIQFDTRPISGVSYYRLKQTDFDGEFSFSNIVSVVIDTEEKQLIKAVNILGQEVNQNTKGMVIMIFSNGESLKIVNE